MPDHANSPQLVEYYLESSLAYGLEDLATDAIDSVPGTQHASTLLAVVQTRSQIAMPAFFCSICLDGSDIHAAASSRLQCGHAFGTRCIANWCSQAPPSPGGPQCPLCRHDISVVDRAWIRLADAKLITTHASDVTGCSN